MSDRLKRPAKRCEEHARKGTGYGTCDAPLDENGNCLYAGNHISTDEART